MSSTASKSQSTEAYGVFNFFSRFSKWQKNSLFHFQRVSPLTSLSDLLPQWREGASKESQSQLRPDFGGNVIYWKDKEQWQRLGPTKTISGKLWLHDFGTIPKSGSGVQVLFPADGGLLVWTQFWGDIEPAIGQLTHATNGPFLTVIWQARPHTEILQTIY